MAYQVIDSGYVSAHLADVPLIDVRPGALFVQGHVPCAINIPYSQIKLETVGEDGPAETPEMAELLAKKFREAGLFPYSEVMVMCQTGRTATWVCEMLGSLGYTNLLLYKGSYQDWVSVPSHHIVAGSKAQVGTAPTCVSVSAVRAAPAFVAVAGTYAPTPDPTAPSSGPHPKAA